MLNDDEYHRTRTEARAFADRALQTCADNADADPNRAPFSWDGWNEAARSGILGLAVADEHGGEGVAPSVVAATMEGLGEGSSNAGLLFSISTHIFAAEVPIAMFGSDEQKERYLPGLASGHRIGAHAITEPDSGSDAFSLKTLANCDGDHYVLEGSKSFVSNGPVADVTVVYATVNPERGQFGVTAFLVEQNTPGFNVGEAIPKMGLGGCPMAEIELNECRVRRANRLGEEGQGKTIFLTAMEWERSCGVAWQIGAMQRQMDRCITYATERRQFGRPVSKFQAVANRLVEMKMRVELSRLLLYRTTSLLDDGNPALMEASMTKLYVSEAAVETHLDAVRIHGGRGYLESEGIERDLRDAVAGPIYSGTSDIQRVIIAGLMGL